MIVVPYTILIDSQEQHPFTFRGMRSDSKQKSLPLVIPTKTIYLGIGKGDYSANFCLERLHIERKSADDIYGTALGFGSNGDADRSRRERFEAELEWLSKLEFSAVVVESPLDELLSNPPQYGTSKYKSKTLFRSILAFQMYWPNVQWVFGSRRLVEIWTFRVINRLWEKENPPTKKRKRKC